VEASLRLLFTNDSGMEWGAMLESFPPSMNNEDSNAFLPVTCHQKEASGRSPFGNALGGTILEK
jgi:hypothetical protein